MAAFAMARELNALLIDEHVDVLYVPRRQEAVAVGGLAPSSVNSLLVAAAAILGGEHATRVMNCPFEVIAFDGKRRLLAEGVVVTAGDGVVKTGSSDR